MLRSTLGFSLLVLLSSSLLAQPGTLLRQIDDPAGKGRGVGIAVDCDGNLYYTNFSSATLHVIDNMGASVRTLTMQTAAGVSVFLNELAYDSTRDVLWGMQQSSTPTAVYTVDRMTGLVTFQWNASTNGLGAKDGIAFDASDDTIWLSEDVSATIEHYRSDGTLIGSITPKNAAGSTLGSISGLTIGLGDVLYLGQSSRVAVVQVKKSNGDFVSTFASPAGNRDEGLECDALTFAPKLALWSRDVDGALSAIELEPETCACGGGICSSNASFQNYGTGCTGTTGIPTVAPTSGATPVLCTRQYSLDISNSLGADTHACLLISPNKANDAVLGCTLLVDLDPRVAIVVGLALPAAGTVFSFNLPCRPEFCQKTFNVQVVTADPGAPQGVSFTAGLELNLGS